ncbi:MAG: hypothetical protein R2731_10540 [Nocardioides sp.]
MLDEASFLVVVRDVLDEPSTLSVAALHELSGLVVLEPSYALAVDWMVCEALARMAGDAGPGAFYLRVGGHEQDQALVRRRPAAARHRRTAPAGAQRGVPARRVGPRRRPPRPDRRQRPQRASRPGPRPRPWPRRACARTWST